MRGKGEGKGKPAAQRKWGRQLARPTEFNAKHEKRTGLRKPADLLHDAVSLRPFSFPHYRLDDAAVLEPDQEEIVDSTSGSEIERCEQIPHQQTIVIILEDDAALVPPTDVRTHSALQQQGQRATYPAKRGLPSPSKTPAQQLQRFMHPAGSRLPAPSPRLVAPTTLIPS